MVRRLDRRVQRTRKLLRDALMALILEEGYDAISIQDITDKANLGRATFYLHFKDKDELLLDVMDQFVEDFLSQVPEFSQSHWHFEDPKAIVKLFDFFAEHYDLYRILIIGSGGITASRQLHKKFTENIKSCIQNDIAELGATPPLPTDFIANHFAGSLLATIYWWLDSDLPYSVEEMAAMFQQINQMDREALLGLDHTTAQTEEDQKERRKKRSRDKSEPRKDAKASQKAPETAEDAPDEDKDKEEVSE